MSRRCVALFVAAFSFVSIGASEAQPTTDSNALAKAEVRFDFARIGLPVPKFTIQVREDGTASYAAEDKSLPTAQEVHRDFTLPPPTIKKIFGHARAVHPDGCASKAKNIADSGTKTLTYITSSATSACTYNYSENKDVAVLTSIFQGIAETLDQGRRLDFLHRFDRLGLDESIAFLAQEVSDGRAIEVSIIEPSLRSIAGDSQVMTRVRTKAAALLALIPANGATN